MTTTPNPERAAKAAAILALIPDVQLDDRFFEAVRGPILSTWQEIGSDVEQAGGRLTNSIAMESVLDANRMSMYGGRDGVGDAADKLVSRACAAHGYPKVMKFLCRKIRLA